MQVYADLRILTARPSTQDEAAAPHRLYGVVDGGERFTVGRWLSAARAALEEARAQGRAAIVVGGTGLYFKALTEGFSEAPPSPPGLLAALQAEAEREGAPALHARLASIDPEGAAALAPNDAPRIIRALAVWETAGQPLRAFAAQQGAPLLAPGDWAGLTLWPDRAALYARIERRFAAMVAAGALEEARAFLARGLDGSLPLTKAHGLPWLAQALAGTMPLEEACALGVRDTRRYAKRQFTWMANQTPTWARVTEEALEPRLATALAIWDGRNTT